MWEKLEVSPALLTSPHCQEFADLRGRIDYNWHTNYTEARQLWQDSLIKSVSIRGEAQVRPWLVFTCGAMGAGKGHAMAWMSRHKIFPLENVVRIDPDYFKRSMPEWEDYVKEDRKSGTKEAGGRCHTESGFMAEIATELALRKGRNTWVSSLALDGACCHCFGDEAHAALPCLAWNRLTGAWGTGSGTAACSKSIGNASGSTVLPSSTSTAKTKLCLTAPGSEGSRQADRCLYSLRPCLSQTASLTRAP